VAQSVALEVLVGEPAGFFVWDIFSGASSAFASLVAGFVVAGVDPVPDGVDVLAGVGASVAAVVGSGAFGVNVKVAASLVVPRSSTPTV
jgi:hypothetical protein